MPAVMHWRYAALLATYAVLLIGGGYIGNALLDVAGIEIRPSTEPRVHMMIMTTAAVFAIASAIPFVPGAEIGFALLLLFGHHVAPLVYVSMVAALLFAYVAGRLVPLNTVAGVFHFFGLRRARDLAARLSTMAPAEIPAMLAQGAPTRIVPWLLRHRYAALVILFNLPGNSLIGGGGGIAFAAGLSRLCWFPAYVLAVLIAVAPVPLFFYFAR